MRLLAVAALLALTGCWSAPIPPDPIPVGERILAWEDLDRPAAVGVEVGEALVTDQTSWEGWVAGLPADLTQPRARDIEQVRVEGSVLVAAAWSSCESTSSLVERGPGRLDLVVERNRDCEADTTTVEVWQVELDELGVDRPDEVRVILEDE